MACVDLSMSYLSGFRLPACLLGRSEEEEREEKEIEKGQARDASVSVGVDGCSAC